MIEDIVKLIPKTLLDKSGAVFYTGKNAFESQSNLYILGFNPGGDAKIMKDYTIRKHTNEVIQKSNWSEYRDESWADGSEPGTRSMQPRVLHLLRKLNLEAGDIPASNLIFLRSNRENTLEGDINTLAEQCWPVHQYVIDNISPRVILCFGKRAGNWVCKKMLAKRFVEKFIEKNNRKWQSSIYQNDNGIKVVVATHPSIADWTSADTDPSDLISKALDLK